MKFWDCAAQNISKHLQNHSYMYMNHVYVFLNTVSFLSSWNKFLDWSTLCQTSLRELTSLGIKNAENLAIPSVRNDVSVNNCYAATLDGFTWREKALT
jgi:hypothetical protein